MKKRGIVLLLVAFIFLAGCDAARISLQEAKLQVFPDHLELALTIGNKGEDIQIFPLEFKLLDTDLSEYTAIEFTGDLADPVGKGYEEQISGTVIFPKVNVEAKRVRIKIYSEVLSSGQRFITTISGTVENGIIEEMTFGN